MTTNWLDEAKAMDVRVVARRLGMALSHDRFGPCPACGQSSRKDESRLPMQAIRKWGHKGWTCNACHTWGDAVSLVSWALLGCAAKDAGSRFGEIEKWFEGADEDASVDFGPIEPREVVRVPKDELHAVLRASTALHRSSDVHVRAWAQRRGLHGQLPAWVVPGPMWAGWRGLTCTHTDAQGRRQPWWALTWVTRFPVVAPAYTGLGELAGLHGRAVLPAQEATQKTTWARGCSSLGLVFADPWLALGALRGSWEGVGALVFVEGFTDFLTASMQARASGAGIAVLGVESGSESAVNLLRGLPSGVGLYVGTHNDAAGDRYAEAIMTRLLRSQKRADVYRLPLWKVEGGEE